VTDEPLSPGHRWAITVAVMLVTVMQIIDTSVTNVVLPHLQGSLSAGVEEVAWVVTSYLAANAIVIPATGWLSSLFGRRRFFLICTVASFLSGIAPNLEFLIVARVFQGIGGGPIIPMSQAIMWEIFPLTARPGDVRVGHRNHDGPDLRTHARRLDRGQLVVALDLLHQPADRARRLLHGQRVPVRPVVPQKAGTDRRARTRADGGGLRLLAADAGSR
jgi:Major Facilitator Superfamily